MYKFVPMSSTDSVVLSKFETAFDSKSRRVGKVTHKSRKITRAEVRKLKELSAAVKPDIDREKIIEKTGTADPVKLVHMARRMKEREITHERDAKRHASGRFVDPSEDMTAADVAAEEEDGVKAAEERERVARVRWEKFYAETAKSWPAEKQYEEMQRRGVITFEEYGVLMDRIRFETVYNKLMDRFRVSPSRPAEVAWGQWD